MVDERRSSFDDLDQLRRTVQEMRDVAAELRQTQKRLRDHVERLERGTDE